MSGVISRRALLRAALCGTGAVTVASVLAACGTTTPSPSTAPAATTAPAVSAGGDNGGTLKIGLLSGFSGPYAAFGPDMANSIEVYLDQHNGLIGGLKATVIQEDESATPQDALLKARKLVEQDRVNVLMGLVSSANALAVRDLLDGSKTPTIITNAGADDLTAPSGVRTSSACRSAAGSRARHRASSPWPRAGRR